MNARTIATTFAIGVCASVAAKALTFPIHAFLVLDLVDGTNLSGNSPGVWQRVVANPIYFIFAMGIGFIAEAISSYFVARINQQRVYSLILLVTTIIATNFVFSLDYPVRFNLLMAVRIFIASYLGFVYSGWRTKQAAKAEKDMPPIARPF